MLSDEFQIETKHEMKQNNCVNVAVRCLDDNTSLQDLFISHYFGEQLQV